MIFQNARNIKTFFFYRMPSDKDRIISRFINIMKQHGIDYKSFYE